MDERRRFNRREVTAKVRLEHEVFGSLEAETMDISDEAVVIDCRSEAAYEDWHYPNAISIPMHDLFAMSIRQCLANNF